MQAFMAFSLLIPVALSSHPFLMLQAQLERGMKSEEKGRGCKNICKLESEAIIEVELERMETVRLFVNSS